MTEFSIKELRARKNVSQEEAAKGIGVSIQTYNRWELYGVGSAKMKNIKRAAEYFGVSVDEIKVA